MMKRVFVLTLASLSVMNSGYQLSACDKPQPAVTAVRAAPTQSKNCDDPNESASELLLRLEVLVEPVSEKVSDCNEDLQRSEAAVTAAEHAVAKQKQLLIKTMTTMLALKEMLSTGSCEVCVGNRIFRRETIAEVTAQKIGEYKCQTATFKELTIELAGKKVDFQETALRVARWIEKERELVDQIGELRKEQDTLLAQATAKSGRVQVAEVVKLAVTIESMLDLNPPSASDSAPNALLAEIDAVLDMDSK